MHVFSVRFAHSKLISLQASARLGWKRDTEIIRTIHKQRPSWALPRWFKSPQSTGDCLAKRHLSSLFQMEENKTECRKPLWGESRGRGGDERAQSTLKLRRNRYPEHTRLLPRRQTFHQTTTPASGFRTIPKSSHRSVDSLTPPLPRGLQLSSNPTLTLCEIRHAKGHKTKPPREPSQFFVTDSSV